MLLSGNQTQDIRMGIGKT